MTSDTFCLLFKATYQGALILGNKCLPVDSGKVRVPGEIVVRGCYTALLHLTA